MGGTIIGVIKVENRSIKEVSDPRDFPKRPVVASTCWHRTVALAITRLQVEQSESRYRVISNALPTIFRILRGGLEVSELVNNVVKETAQLFNAKACALFLKDGNRLIQPPWAAVGWAQRGPEIREYELVELSQIKDNPTQDEKVGLTVWIAVKQEKFTARSNLELRMHPHHKGTFDVYNFGGEQRCESFMGVPLVVGHNLVGVLKVETKVKEEEEGLQEFTYFNEQDELVFDLIANSAAVAIENARIAEAERLAEQIRSQRQRLLLDLHAFLSEHWRAAETLSQAADSLRRSILPIAQIIDSYVALLQPDPPPSTLETFLERVMSDRWYLEGSTTVIALYSSFANTLAARSFEEIAEVCAVRGSLEAGELMDGKPFLEDVTRYVREMYAQVASCLGRDNGRSAVRTALSEACDHLGHAHALAEKVQQPERAIFLRIIKLWSDVFKRALERHFDRIVNPYVAGRPLDPTPGCPFFGRTDVFRWVAENLYGATQQNILVLHGEKRMGKTSILLQLARGELGRPLRERSDKPLYPVFVDLQAAPDHGTHVFLSELTREIRAQLSKHQTILRLPPVPSMAEFERRPYERFRDFMRSTSKALGTGLLVLMLDEFEALDRWVTERRVDASIYSVFRDQMQFSPNVSYILAGTHKLDELSAEYRNLVFTGPLHREVGFMMEEDAHALIREPVAGTVVYERDAVDELVHVTHGHPYMLQFLCHRIIDEMNRRSRSNLITLVDVHAAVDYIVRDGSQHLRYMWDSCTPVEQTVLAAVVHLEEHQRRPYSQTDVAERLKMREMEVSVAFKHLLRRHLIEESTESDTPSEERAYQPTMTPFSRWIRREMPLGQHFV